MEKLKALVLSGYANIFYGVDKGGQLVKIIVDDTGKTPRAQIIPFSVSVSTPPNPLPTPGSTWVVEFHKVGAGWVQPEDHRTFTVKRIDSVSMRILYSGSWAPDIEHSGDAAIWTEAGVAIEIKEKGYDRVRCVQEVVW